MRIADLRELVDFIEKTERDELQFDTSRHKNSPSVWGYCNKGTDLIINGKFEDAVSAYRQAIELEPEFAEAHFGIGWAFLKQGKLEDAVGSFEKSIKLEKHSRSYRFLGRTLLQLGKLDEAKAAFEEAIKLKPDSALSYCYLGAALACQNEYFQADIPFRSAVSLDPDNAILHLAMANNLFLMNEEEGLLTNDWLEEAVKHCEQAISLSPNFAEAHFCLGTTLCKLGKRDEAKKHYQIAANLGYKDAQRLFAKPKGAAK